MTTYSPSTVAASRSTFLHAAAILTGAILAIGQTGSASADTNLAQASSEDTLARCQQLYGLYSRHNSDGYARPLDARMALEDCQRGNVSSGIATLKRVLERAQIAIPPAEASTAQPPAAAPTLRPRGEKRRESQ
jgi:hypothetical protein